MASEEELLSCIAPGMRLTKDFFKRIYGYEISCPGFSGQAIAALEAAGCSKARQYYEEWVREWNIRQKGSEDNGNNKPRTAACQNSRRTGSA